MSAGAAAFLELERLAKRFGDVPVLEELSLAVGEGEVLALLGPSGSGKTTALRLVAGFETPDSGALRLAGEDLTALGPAQRGFGMVFQHYALFPHMTVGENVAFGLESRGWKRERQRERVREMLELVDLAGFAGRRVSEISGGQQQRVALARALAPEPRVLLLDEPLSNLDPDLRGRTRRELRAAVRRIGITTLLVTHEQEEAFHVGDRVALLHRGRLQQVATPEVLYQQPASRFVATFIGHAGLLPGTFAGLGANGRSQVRLGGGAVVWEGIAAEALGEGEAIDFVVRPESLRLVAPMTPGALPGRCVERRFTGVVTYCAIRLADGSEIEVQTETGSARHEEVGVLLGGGGPVPRIFRREAAG